MKNDQSLCPNHQKPFVLIGNDNICQLNCRICLDCLKGIDNSHKKGLSNHETISIQQISHQFNKIQQYHNLNISQCTDLINKYYKKVQESFMQLLCKQKDKMMRLMKKIIFSNISKDQQKINIIQKLYHKQLQNISCKQVYSISSLLFNYIPKQNNDAGFKKMIDVINTRYINLSNDVQDIMQSKSWKNICINDIQQKIKSQNFDDITISRIKTQYQDRDNDRRTLRRSYIKRQIKNIDVIKDRVISIKKPLELIGSRIVQNKEDSVFVNKLFQNKNIQNCNLLYRATQYNFSIKDFHKLCDGEINTLVIIKTQFNKIIGGFTPLPWKSTANTLHSDHKCQSFIFSLSLKQKMNLIDQKSAIFNSVNFGPTFGAGADIAICHNANIEKTSYSQFPYSYSNARYRQSNQHSTMLFTGQKKGNHFLLKQWEVWKINFAF